MTILVSNVTNDNDGY